MDNNLRQARQSFGFNRQLPYTGARDNNFTANRRLDISAIPGFPQNNLYQQSQQHQPPIPQSTPVPPTTFTPTYIASPSTPPYTAPANINSLPASSETAMLIKALLPSGKSWDLHRSIKDKLQQPASMNLLTVSCTFQRHVANVIIDKLKYLNGIQYTEVHYENRNDFINGLA